MSRAVALPPFQSALKAGLHGVEDRDGKFAIDGAMLRQITDGECFAADHFALHGRQQACQHFEQGGFSAAVSSTEYEEILVPYHERTVLQDYSVAVSGVDVFESNQRRNHGRMRVERVRGQCEEAVCPIRPRGARWRRRARRWLRLIFARRGRHVLLG